MNRPVWIVSASCIPKPFVDGEDKAVIGAIGYPWCQAELPELHARLRVRYELALGFLSKRLNTMHGVNRSRRYWHLVVGPWLHRYLNLVCHHYESLCQAQAQLGDLECVGLDADYFVTPADTRDFIYEATDDLYDLQLYTLLCAGMGIPVVERRRPTRQARIADSENPEDRVQIAKGIIKRVKDRALYEARKRAQLILGPRARILFHRSYLPARFEWKLVAKMHGRVWPYDGPLYRSSRERPVDPTMRAGLSGCNAGEDKLGTLIGSLLVQDIPKVFVEDYFGLVTFAESAYAGFKPDALVRTAPWAVDHAFSHFAAMRAEAGACLVGGQHGGDHNLRNTSQIEDFERSLVDRYLTWGWSNPDDPGIIPTPAARLVEVQKRRPPLKGQGILYVGTVALRSNLDTNGDFSGYSSIQRRFFDAVGPALRSEFQVRLHTSDFGWGIKRRLAAAFPDLKFAGWERTFSQSLLSSRLYVCDHLSTTFTEAIATNTPTVMFWDPIYTAIRPSAQPLFDQARTAGFVHDTPESAARWIARVYPDVEDWWFDPATQNAVSEFRDRFGRTSTNPMKEWVSLLDRLAMKCASTAEEAESSQQLARSRRRPP